MNFIDRMIEAVCKWVLHFFKNEETRNKVAKIVNREVATYIIAGVLTTVVNWLVSFIFNDLLKVESVVLTNSVAWVVAVAFAYWINDVWVFQEKYESAGKEIVKIGKFVSSRIATGIIEVGGMWLFVDKLELPFWPVKIIISFAVIVLNYVFSKIFVFVKAKAGKEADKKDVQ